MRVRLEKDYASLPTLVTPLGAGKYRLEETEWTVDLFYHDIIQADDLGLETLGFVRVVERSDLVVTSGVFHKEFLDSAALHSTLHWLRKRGGFWQIEMGGMLLLSMPKDLEAEFEARWEQVHQDRARSDLP